MVRKVGRTRWTLCSFQARPSRQVNPEGGQVPGSHNDGFVGATPAPFSLADPLPKHTTAAVPGEGQWRGYHPNANRESGCLPLSHAFSRAGGGRVVFTSCAAAASGPAPSRVRRQIPPTVQGVLGQPPPPIAGLRPPPPTSSPARATRHPQAVVLPAPVGRAAAPPGTSPPAAQAPPPARRPPRPRPRQRRQPRPETVALSRSLDVGRVLIPLPVPVRSNTAANRRRALAPRNPPP